MATEPTYLVETEPGDQKTENQDQHSLTHYEAGGTHRQDAQK